LEKINLHYYASIRIEISEKFRTPTARQALYYVEHYLNALIVQWNRIADDLQATSELMNADLLHDRAAASVLLQFSDRTDFDIHFFLISWDKIQKFLELFDTEQKDPVVSSIHAEIAPLLAKGSEVRHYFEHLNDRLAQGGGLTLGRGYGGGATLNIAYEVRQPGSVIEQRLESFGREEVRRVALAYNRILEHLGAKLQPSFMGTEMGKPGDQPPGGFP
jgi:hypothetical protein